MSRERKCVSCGKLPPQTETAYTLIGNKFGWRVTRHRSPNGEMVVEWRCGDCWRKYKNEKGLGASSGQIQAVDRVRPDAKDDEDD